MCCENKISFGIKNIGNMVTHENGVPLFTPLSVQDYVASKPVGDYWIEKSRWGYTGICTTLPYGQDLVLTLQQGMINYQSEPVDFVGGHPVHRPPTA